MPPRSSRVNSNYIFFQAVNENDIRTLRERIHTVDLDTYDAFSNTALIIAITKGYSEIAKFLIEKGANVNKMNMMGTTPLIVATDKNNIEIMKQLLDAGAGVNKESTVNGFTPLLTACMRGNITGLDLLLERGADIEKRNKNEDTPLIMAAYTLHLPIVKKLISLGADLNKQNKQGSTALLLAVSRGSRDITQYLISVGADVNIENEKSETPLQIAVLKKDTNTVKLLIDARVDINKTNKDNRTPLLLATLDHNIEIVELLINANADVNIEDKNHDTVLDYAAGIGIIKLINLILKNKPILTDKIKESIEDLIYKPEVIRILKDYFEPPEEINKNGPKWEGIRRSDIEIYDTVFDDVKGIDYSYCPVCLKYNERKDACNYMSHNCSEKGYYNKKLYNKYKNNQGLIFWCTICGRICAGHYHYPIVSADAPKPVSPYINPSGRQDHWEKDCRLTSGGGGIPEKIARIRQFRETALELQEDIGKITEDEARNILVTESWNAPLLPTTRKLEKIGRTKKWNIPITNYPANVAPVSSNTVVKNANDPTKYSVPVVLSPGVGAAGEGRNEGYNMNSVSLADDIPLIVFKHKDKNENDYVHPQIGKDSVLGHIMTSETQGKCFDVECGGFLYPREIEMAFENPKMAPTVMEKDREIVAKYKEWFNKWRAENVAKGGKRRTRYQKRNYSKKTRKAIRK